MEPIQFNLLKIIILQILSTKLQQLLSYSPNQANLFLYIKSNFYFCILISCLLIFCTPQPIQQCLNDLYIQYLEFINKPERIRQDPKSDQYYWKKCLAFTQGWKQFQIQKQKNPGDYRKFPLFLDLTPEQRQSRFNIKSVPFTIAQMNAKPTGIFSPFFNVGAIPQSIDYRKQKKVSSIKDQGECGSCWAFATVGLYQSFLMYKGESQYDLSEEYILQCTTTYTKNIEKSSYRSDCNGGYLSFPMQLAKINGIPLESKYPYISKYYTGWGFQKTPGICSSKGSYLYAKRPLATSLRKYTDLTNSQMISLLANGPLAVAITANYLFAAHRSGVFRGCSSWYSKYTNNHAVIVVGYTENGDYIIKNSWGTDWGQQGFAIIDKYYDCGLTAEVYQYTSGVDPGQGLYYTDGIDLENPQTSNNPTNSDIRLGIQKITLILVLLASILLL